DIVVTFPDGTGANTLEVRAGPGLRHGDGAYQFATRHARQVFALLLFRAVIQQVVGGDAVDPGAEAGQCPSGSLLVQHCLVPEVASASAILLGNIGAKYPESASLAPDLMTDMPALAGFLVVRHEFVFQEPHHRIAIGFQIRIGPGRSKIDCHDWFCSVYG